MFLLWPVLSYIRPPHHLCSQRVEEDVVEALHHLDAVVGARDGEAGGFTARLAASVDGHEEVVAAAFDVEGDFPVVADDDGAHVEAVGCHGGDGDGLAVGHDDGASHAQRVGGGAGGGGYDESVGLVGGEGGAVDGGVDAYHR